MKQKKIAEMCGDVEKYHPSGCITSKNDVSVIMYGSVISHSQNIDPGAFISMEDNKKKIILPVPMGPRYHLYLLNGTYLPLTQGSLNPSIDQYL